MVRFILSLKTDRPNSVYCSPQFLISICISYVRTALFFSGTFAATNVVRNEHKICERKKKSTKIGKQQLHFP
jgi:hypothetical protein